MLDEAIRAREAREGAPLLPILAGPSSGRGDAILEFAVHQPLVPARLYVLLAFTGESVTSTFLVTAGMFGGLAAYGTATRRSLDGLGQFLFMGLIGVVLASFVGIFWHSDGLQFVISFIGVIVFTIRHTPRFWGHPSSAGDFDFARICLRPLRTS